MSEGLRRAADDPRRREAIEWFAAHAAGEELTPAQLLEWECWVDEPRNREEYVEIARVQYDARALARPSLPSRDELLADGFATAQHPKHPQRLQRPHPPRQVQTPAGSDARSAWWQWPLAMAAAVGLLAFAAALFLSVRSYLFPSLSLEPGRAYSTRTGEQRQFTLADGSTMTLGGDTAAAVRFTATGRTVVLSRGEGQFRVEHEAQRPFFVCAAQACVQAVGTVFDVRLYSNRVHVWVEEGAVEVAPVQLVSLNHKIVAETPRWRPRRVTHGQQMSYDTRGDASAPEPADARVAAGWTQGTLNYRGRPLSEVIEDVQRYSGRPLLLDPSVADLQYSGSVMQQHIDQWILGLPEVFPIDIVDCRSAVESAAGRADAPPPPCVSNPDRILIRSRATR
ncbi:MAG TPA: FecR domain-containing protein [Steroidobacteraceae bacterium]|nr:FecR domain-containing protein [Steroidobacteraceae bacterium]